MTLTLQQARDIVTAAVTNGLVYDDTWPLNSTPEQFERTFRDFDEQLRLGNGLYACWLLARRYRVSRFNNEIVEASTLLASGTGNLQSGTSEGLTLPDQALSKPAKSGVENCRLIFMSKAARKMDMRSGPIVSHRVEEPADQPSMEFRSDRSNISP